jgi:hypothetical protein
MDVEAVADAVDAAMETKEETDETPVKDHLLLPSSSRATRPI